MKKYLLFFALSIIAISCSDDLDRNNAKKQIISKATDLDCTFSIKKSWISDYRSNGVFCTVTVTNPPSRSKLKEINHLVNKGFFKLNKKTISRDCAQWTKSTITVTEKGKPFLIKEENNKIHLLASKFEITDITGIKRENKSSTSTVEYQLKKVEKTPFFDLGNINCYEEGKDYSKTFTKYDDGWRIDK